MRGGGLGGGAAREAPVFTGFPSEPGHAARDKEESRTYARDKYAGAMALSSADFDAPAEVAAAVPLDPEEERRQFMERFGGATGLGSSDVYGGGEDANGEGMARKMASTGLDGARKIGGWAASSASTWLQRGNAAFKE